jgi:hypothetical protein
MLCRMNYILLALLFALPAAAQDRVRIYLKPPASAFVDETSKGQADTFKDLAERLSKKPAIELVESPDRADVTLSILDRDPAKDTGTSSTSTVKAPTGLLSSTSQNTTRSVTIALTAGEYSKELTASKDTMFGAWKYIAGKLADQVEKWAKDNAATISARRP